MSQEDYAVLIGVSGYPKLLGDNGKPADLNAPGNDVAAFESWLLSQDGGAVPPRNIWKITSNDFPGHPDQLSKTAIENKFIDVDTKWGEVLDARNKSPLVLGRRLYIFASGHGFSPRLRRGALYSGDANQRFGQSIDLTAWFEWFQEAGSFQEMVMLLDCCMNIATGIVPQPPGGRPRVNPLLQPAAPAFVAFGARRPLRAAEYPDILQKGQYNSAFTTVLLEGLKGAAVDHYGRVTSQSLASWLWNSLSSRLSADDRKDGNVSCEPEIVQKDEGLVFARVPVKTYPVTLSFDQVASRRQALLWSGGMQPAHILDIPEGATPAVTLQLAPGLHLVAVAVPDRSLRQGFEVVGPTQVEVRENGDPVEPHDATVLFDLLVDPQSATAEIFVIDRWLELIEQDRARLQTRLPFGLYKLKVRDAGRWVKETVFALDADWRPPDVAPAVGTAAPVAGMAQTHEYHELPAARERAKARADAASEHAGMLLMARVWSGSVVDPAAASTEPWKGVYIVDESGLRVLDFERGEVHGEMDPWAIASRGLRPGAYFLRQQHEDGTETEQAVIVPPEWIAEVYILLTLALAPSDGAARLGPVRRLAIQLRRIDSGLDGQRDDKLVETARSALAEERRIYSDTLAEMLFGPLVEADPMAAIIGAHLLLVEQERGGAVDLSRLNDLVPRLRKLLGEEFPDVEALSLKCPDVALRRTRPVQVPPMFLQSWRLLAGASVDCRELVPASVSERAIAAAQSARLYLTWSIDDERRNSAKASLATLVARADTTTGESLAGGERAGDAGAAAAPRTQSAAFSRADAARTAKNYGIPFSALTNLSKIPRSSPPRKRTTKQKSATAN